MKLIKKKKLVLKAKPKPQTPKDKLIELIIKAIKDDPFEYDGHVWCAMPQVSSAADALVIDFRRELTRD